MRKMILAENAVERKKALEKLLPLQKNDFVGLFKEMRGLPVTIRLLDPPLHEFLPRVEELLVEVTKLKATKKKIKSLAQKEALLRKVRNLHEMNPMLGHRGCRLAITYPEIVEMQTRAIFEAAVEVAKEGIKVLPEVMIPVVGIAQEVKLIKEQIVKIATEIIKSAGVKVKYTVGTMMELPRACLIADKIAKEASFFSFGTNDLTQTTFGFSRDDAEGKFIVEYINKGILAENPFQVLDKDGVGALIKMSVEKGRLVNPNLKIGICGEHGGEPKSIAFCHSAELDYVSCSPYRVPIARLAAAQAAVEAKRKK
jgi:pyruvate,orthophosphate dikinase